MDRRFPLTLAFAATLALGQEHHIPEQPIEFSHMLHVALPLKCRDCHTNPDPGKSEGLPAASKCMACHFSIANDKPEVRKLRSYADRKEPIPWVPVYEVPDFVKFSHRAHGRFRCDKCHGPVETRDALWRETDISMGGCVTCHRQNRAPTKCRVCHEDRR
jgi:hypothetical protein